MIKILGYDMAREGSDNTAIQFQFPKAEAINPPELPKVGEEFPLTRWGLQRCGLHPDAKLIVTSVYERNGIPYITALVR